MMRLRQPVLQRRGALAGALLPLSGFTTRTQAEAPPPGFKSALATADQDAVAAMDLHILQDARVHAARDRARHIMAKDPLAHLADGRARLDHVPDAWVTHLAF